ncbi:helicase/secretion neighborhood CpaE-like protein [Raineyella antarctica]|uniref:Helicase/secretion neighborhood CpaE-like protein n=1 Tax=Raineyella antarctica TaxID=1577474 RepID=A0A1G6GFS0_9ACTN|nr:helicase/secretion neighborhood CpaE-like protein [Raineyella antarctica]
MMVGERADLVRAVESVTATLASPAPQTLPAAHLPARWGTAATILVGIDAAAVVADLGLPPRSGVHLLGGEEDLAELGRWSGPIGASLIVVPRDSALLGRALQGGRVPDAARTVAVVSGGGGAGASTTAAGLAGAAALDGHSAVLVDLDPWGGGLDLLVGAEGRPGWRWDDLARARGGLGSLTGRLPGSEGVDVVTMGRSGHQRLPDEEAVDCVLAAARASYDLVVLDVAPSRPWVEHLARAASALLVAGPGIRQVAAARQVAIDCAEDGLDLWVVARVGPGAGAEPVSGLAGEALELPVAGTIPHDRRLPLAAERGDAPWRVARRAWTRACAQALAQTGAFESGSGALR